VAATVAFTVPRLVRDTRSGSSWQQTWRPEVPAYAALDSDFDPHEWMNFSGGARVFTVKNIE